MTFSNKGRIRPAAGPEGHTHSIYQLNDIAASGVDNQTLVSSNGLWVAQTAIPYAMVAGTYIHPTVINALASGAGLKLSTIVYADYVDETPFTAAPIVNATQSSLPGGSGVIITKINAGNNPNSFDLYVYNAGATAATILANSLSFNWTAIQMATSTATGVTSTDPQKA